MGKHENSSPKHGRLNKSGWLSGMLHVFDFHHWRRTKNRPICWKTPRTHSLMRESEEQEPFLDSEMLSVVADNKTTRQETKLKKKIMSTKQVTEYVDFLEILRKEDVFVKIMKDQVQIKSNPRVLPKSGSFPLSRSSSSRPVKIEHKLKENWYAAPRQNSAVLTLNVPRVTSQEHKPFKDRFKEIKKVIKNALKDRNPTKKKKKKKVSDVDYVGRYSQLLEHSFRREDGKLRSKSLKIDSRDNKPQFFRRISSLSSLEVLGSFLTDLPQDQDTNLGSKKPLSESLVSGEKEERYEVQEEKSQDIPNQQDPDSVPDTDTPQKTETLSYNHEEEDVYFGYVKKALEISGNGEKWYTEEQPLDPSFLNGLEIQDEELVNNKELLFDLLNEAIVETHNQTHIYFPKTCPFGKSYVDEVWGRFKWNISGLGDENRDRSLDDIVGRDLRKTDGWMNLRGDSEWLTLELEELIFDDVLDELLCVY